MLEEFRALGGTAENICLKQGRYGRGLFPKDASKPVQIRIPDCLLVDHKYAEFHNGAFRLAADAPVGARERAFLENYERDFSWPEGRREMESILETMQEGSPELRDLIGKSYYGFRWVVEPTDEVVQQRFLESRVINYKGSDVIMPIVELANHGHAARYQTKDGVGLSGTFADEVLVRYQLCDPLQIFGKWGFASDSEFLALSVHVKQEQAGINITRSGDPRPESETKPFLPTATIEGGQIKLPYLLLGHRQLPALPRGNFLRLMRDAGRLRNEADYFFDDILHANRMHMLQLIAASEDAPPRLGRLLRNVARFQLEAMSFCIGRAEV
jgi:hypothetical protein